MEVGRRAAKLSGDTQAEERIRRELRRLQRAEKAQDAIVEAAVAQKRREAVAAAAREAGLALEQAAADAKAAAGVSRATAGDPIRCAPSNPFASVQELGLLVLVRKSCSGCAPGQPAARALRHNNHCRGSGSRSLAGPCIHQEQARAGQVALL